MDKLWKIKNVKTKRISSWEKNGRNSDYWIIPAGERKIIADIKGPGKITHIWMTTGNHYRELLIKITWDNAEKPSVLVPYGDFFGLGHSIVNSYQSLLFTASTNNNNKFNKGCALNCYLQMPFRERCVIELINEAKEEHRQYFYIDYELYESADELGSEEEMGYLHAEFHRENPFGGWGHEIRVNTPEANIINKERLAWENNYIILETQGRGHYIGCNYSISNFQGTWWGEGDDMIWVDGYKWPPDLHGTGSEDYFNQAWGMQPNSFLRNGSSIYERDTEGYQTSYVFHIENPVRFQKEIKVTIEFGHGNHLRNEVSSVAYWYANKPTAVKDPPQVEKRMPVLKDKEGNWIVDEKATITSREIQPNEEMNKMKVRWKGKNFPGYFQLEGTLCMKENGTNIVCVEMFISKDNPELFIIPLEEILDYFIDTKIIIEKNEGMDSIYGKLKAQDGHLYLTGVGGVDDEQDSRLAMGEILKGMINTKVSIEALMRERSHNGDIKKEIDAEYIIYFKNNE